MILTLGNAIRCNVPIEFFVNLRNRLKHVYKTLFVIVLLYVVKFRQFSVKKYDILDGYSCARVFIIFMVTSTRR